MSQLLEIENQIAKLSEVELKQFREWFEEYQANAWDAQIERDILDGKWDAEFDAALQEHAEGKTTPL